MNRRSAAYEDTHLFEWESEPALERPSRSFNDTEFPLRRASAGTHGRSGIRAVLLGGAVAVMISTVALIELARRLHIH